MELILKQDVEGLGFKDDVVTVKNGYGRNFLIPGGKAILATTSAKKVLAENLKQRAFKDKKIIEDASILRICPLILCTGYFMNVARFTSKFSYNT